MRVVISYNPLYEVEILGNKDTWEEVQESFASLKSLGKYEAKCEKINSKPKIRINFTNLNRG
jgi:hypothetical protein